MASIKAHLIQLSCRYLGSALLRPQYSQRRQSRCQLRSTPSGYLEQPELHLPSPPASRRPDRSRRRCRLERVVVVVVVYLIVAQISHLLTYSIGLGL